MRKRADEDSTIEDESDKPSVSPALAGAAVYAGSPAVMGPMFGLPFLAAKGLQSGVPIEADIGTPIQRLAEFTKEEVRAIRGFAEERGVTVPIVRGADELAGGGSYFADADTPLSRLISKITKEPRVPTHIGLANTSVPQALHEIGHASPIFGSDKLRQALLTLSHGLGQTSNIGHVLRLGLASSVFVPPTEDSSPTRQFLYNNAPALVGATMVPQLLEEARASTNAMRGAREFGPGLARTFAELGPNFATYLAGAAAPVIATILAKRVVAALRDRFSQDPQQAAEGETKTSAPMPGNEVKAPGILRSSASSAWKVGGNPPKPKTIPPNATPGSLAGGRATAKPPSKTSFYKDLISTLYNPARGSRLSTPG